MAHPVRRVTLALLVVAVAASALRTAGADGDPPSAPASPPPPPAASAPATRLPPDGEGATKALVDSPRHGEWVDIPLPAEAKDGKAATLKTWVSYPERKDNAPVVIVIHEIFGLTDWVRAVADQLAAEGFIAVAPDLLSGKGPNGGATASFTGDAVREAIRSLDANEVVARLNAARDYAIALPAATRKSACIGFCWGGTTAWTYATRQPALDGAIVYYGTAPTSKDAIATIRCPVLGLYGGNDQRVTSTVEPTTKLVAEAQKAFSPCVYDGAGHGFLRQQKGQEGKNEAAAREAWRETLAFLRAQLEAAPK